MPIILDTDVLTILQLRKSPVADALHKRLSRVLNEDLLTTVVSFQEQIQGWMAYLHQARNERQLLQAYAELLRVLEDFSAFNVVPFDATALKVFNSLRAKRVRIGTMDLRIAAIALARGATVITRNTRDFGQVPGLSVEDWTTGAE
jgi:tRNA(fMet)-specific endonuclease VapC